MSAIVTLLVPLAAVLLPVTRSVAQSPPAVRVAQAPAQPQAQADAGALAGENVAESRREDWQAVEQALQRGLPRTAIEKLQPLIENAMRDDAHAEAIRAIALKIALEAETEGNGTETKVTRMRAELARDPAEPRDPAEAAVTAEMRPVMEAILANWLWQYFQENRWRLMQRTPMQPEQPVQPERTGETTDSEEWDLATWDLPRILAEADRQFDRALAEAETLQATPVERFDALFEAGTAGDAYRPTVYDVLAHNALRFYAAGEQAAVPDPDPMVLEADGPIFSTVDDFLAWRPDAGRDLADRDRADEVEENDQGTEADLAVEDRGLTRRAIELYQDLLRFHRDDDDRSAFLDTDLARLQFGNSHAVGDSKGTRYRAALRRFAEANPEHPISARAWHELGTSLQAEGELVEAHQAATRGAAAFPTSIGGLRCRNLITEIEAPESMVTTERVWAQPAASIEVAYRNVTEIHFRLLRVPPDEAKPGESWAGRGLDPDDRRQLIARPAAHAWSAELPATEDYQQRVESLNAPLDVDPGLYLLVASHDEDFRETDNQVSFSEVWVSNLAIVTRTGQRGLEGFVLDAESGEPLAGAEVESWRRTRGPTWDQVASTTTDGDGKFRFDTGSRTQLIVKASHDGQAVTSAPLMSFRPQRPQGPREETRLFTDRAIYRPGQTVHYKGISFRADTDANDYQTLARRAVTVTLFDANGEEVERVEHRTNDYGSFAGSVTAPRDRLTGMMSLRVDSPQGQTPIRVEEYKRPKFRVDLDAPDDPPGLGDPVAVRGQAVEFTGATIQDAEVRWRVVREVRFPMWWRWGPAWPRPERAKPVATGVTRTDADGRFRVEFVAEPDRSISPDSSPFFTFRVEADVTDGTGETRSGERRVRVGYVSLEATMSANEWLTESDPVEIEIRTQSLGGDGQASRGKVEIFSLVQPDTTQRPRLPGAPTPIPRPFSADGRIEPGSPDPTDRSTWEDGELVYESDFETDAAGRTTVATSLDAGPYRARLATADAAGREVRAMLPLTVIDTDAEQFGIRLPSFFRVRDDSVEPGETFEAVWGTGYESGRAYVEIEQAGRVLQSYWTEPGRTQSIIRQPITDPMRGGITLRVTFVRENRAHLHTQRIDVPWTDRELEIRWERFVSKLGPAAKETWTAVVTGPDAQRQAAEMVATLYDASLDTFATLRWPERFDVFRRENSLLRTRFENDALRLRTILSDWRRDYHQAPLTYRDFPQRIMGTAFPQLMPMRIRSRNGGGPEMAAASADGAMSFAAPAEGVTSAGDPFADMGAKNTGADAEAADGSGGGEDERPDIDLGDVPIRGDLRETAFFFPQLVAGQDGTVRIEFTMPEALTEWRFLGFAHDHQLRSGSLTDTAATSLDLMVRPNPPRFLREGDEIEFTVKVVNRSTTRQRGTARLSLADARTTDSVDEAVENVTPERDFDLAAGDSRTFAWRLSIPDGIGPVTYRAVASSGKLSDGEEGFLAVLSRRVPVTDSLALAIRGPGTRRFDFERLLESADSESIRHQSLTVQVTSNPAWYAVLALPTLMESPHESSDRVFQRLYAHSLGHQLVTSDPKIKRVFDRWRGTETLDSPLEKNESIKGILIEETPWVRQADNESQSRRNVALLFDENRLRDETGRAWSRLTELQRDDGAWPWFPGGGANLYMTMRITTGLGRLSGAAVPVDVTPARRSIGFLDGHMSELANRIDADDRDDVHLSPTVAMYLYARSFFLDDQPLADEHRGAFRFWVDQAKRHWVDLPSRLSQAHVAIALHRIGEREAAAGVMASLRERSVVDDELGRYWRDQERSPRWFHAPVETQAMMIEAFDEVAADPQVVAECQVWLLKRKQTTAWETGMATADAVDALLRHGADPLASDQIVSVTLGAESAQPDQPAPSDSSNPTDDRDVFEPMELRPSDAEAGTGFFEVRFGADTIRPEMGTIEVTKEDAGIAWGGIHWQYFESLDRVASDSGSGLSVRKRLFVKRDGDGGPELAPIEGTLAVGDELVSRIELRADRDFDFVHLKDHRGSGTEPVNVLSRHRWQDGLGYYESTRDAASHFFIESLRKGVYVFEVSTRVQLAGRYQSGHAEAQCLIAPEFRARSQSVPIEVVGTQR